MSADENPDPEDVMDATDDARPDRVWLCRNHWPIAATPPTDHERAEAVANDNPFAEFVLADRLAAIARERVNLLDERKAAEAERDALRARVEELEAVVEDLIDRKNDHPTDLYWSPAWDEAFSRARALLSGGSREKGDDDAA